MNKSKTIITTILVGVVVGGSYRLVKTDRTIPLLTLAERKNIAEYQSLSADSRLLMAPPEEPGRRLLLCVRVVDKATQAAASAKTVHLYHTTDDGVYEPATEGDDSTARLSGSGVTDERGRVFVETILPGDYGSTADNRHIHTTVRGSQPDAYDIHFKQYSTFMLRRFVSRSDQHFLADLRRTAAGELVCTVTIAAAFAK